MTAAWHRKIMRVQYKDTDQMGIVHHGNYINWFEVGRTEWMRHHGMSYHKMEELGLLLPVMDVNATYKKPAHFDDCVAIFTKAANCSPVRLEFQYEARRISEAAYNQLDGSLSEPNGELLAKGTTKHMWVNPEWKPVRLNKTAPEVYAILENLN